MKKSVIVLFVLGITNLGFSQNRNGQVKEVKLEEVMITNANFSYLEKVQGNGMSNYVSLLQNEAAKFDVSVTSEFDGRNEPFNIIFKGNKGHIDATYDNNGKILKTTEWYNDIKLPVNIRKSVLEQYPNSGLLKVVYTVNYNDKKEVEKTYYIKIKKDNSTKNLKIKSSGDLNNVVTMSMVD